jgi:hypothetical protein
MTGSRSHADEVSKRIAARYQHFSDVEARGRSPLYVQVAHAIARDQAVLDFLAQMPPIKRQPNLLLGAVRYLYGTPREASAFVALIREHAHEIAQLMASRSTQTNEPARCATLLPVLARLPQPLALLEVGAAAGLCLLPDRYAYDYGAVQVGPGAPVPVEPPVFRCRAGAGTPLPQGNVEVAWRAGLDLRPVDLFDEAEVRWLEALVWPGEDYRLAPLRAACEIARADPPRVVQGDLREDLDGLAAQAPPDATLVVFHTAVLAYVTEEADRAAFADAVGALDAVWVANEGADLIPGVSEEVRREREGDDVFLLCVDRRPTAWTDGHGTFIDWRG